MHEYMWLLYVAGILIEGVIVTVSIALCCFLVYLYLDNK